MLWLYQSPLSYSTSMIRLPRWRMETSSLQSSWSGNGNGNGKRCRVYIATTGLRVPQGPPQWALSALSLTGWDSHQHCMTILQPATHGRVWLLRERYQTCLLKDAGWLAKPLWEGVFKMLDISIVVGILNYSYGDMIAAIILKALLSFLQVKGKFCSILRICQAVKLPENKTKNALYFLTTHGIYLSTS
eukprot:c14292_g1_i1 orf=288-854(-)